MSPETTFVTEPLNEKGEVDFDAALNLELSRGLTPENNAAVDYLKALGPGTTDAEYQFHQRMSQALGVPALPRDAPTLKKFEDVIWPFTEFPTEEYDEAKEFPWAKETFPDLAKWLAANEQALNHLHQLSRKPNFFFPQLSPPKPIEMQTGVIDISKLDLQSQPSLQTSLMAELLQLRSMLYLGEKQYAAACEDLLALHHWGRHDQRRAFSTLEFLGGNKKISVAFVGDSTLIANPDVPASVLRNYRQQLLKLPLEHDIDHVMEWAERFYGLKHVQDLVETIENAEPTSLADAVNNPLRAVTLRFYQLVDWNQVMITLNEEIDQGLPLLRKAAASGQDAEYQKHAKRIQDLPDERDTFLAKLTITPTTAALRQEATKVMSNYLLDILYPAVLGPLKSQRRSFMRQELSIIGLAIAEYRLTHGQYPQDLSELQPEFLRDIPADRFSNQSLIYQGGKETFLLYSIGENQRDDQGKTYGEVVIVDGQRDRADDLVISYPQKEVPQ